MRVAYRAPALWDLAEIEAGLGFDDAAAANRLHGRLLDACEGLADFPEKGRRAARSDMRELVTVRPYVIIYRLQRDAVVIFRIVHGARQR